MSDLMPIEQAEFIDTLQRYFSESSNMCSEDCYRIAFIVWQHKDYISKMLGYEKGKADAIKNTELFREIFLNELIEQSVTREEAIMYRDICTMSWNKYLERLKESKE